MIVGYTSYVYFTHTKSVYLLFSLKEMTKKQRMIFEFMLVFFKKTTLFVFQLRIIKIQCVIFILKAMNIEYKAYIGEFSLC